MLAHLPIKARRNNALSLLVLCQVQRMTQQGHQLAHCIKRVNFLNHLKLGKNLPQNVIKLSFNLIESVKRHRELYLIQNMDTVAKYMNVYFCCESILP